jgi:thiosulfate dehydrogenase (quinone) large subunit
MPQEILFCRVLACCRIFVGVMFFLFGEYKVFRPGFAHQGGFQYWLNQFAPLPFYQPFLARCVAPHPAFWAYVVGFGELAIGLSLMSGLFVRAASLGGIFEMLNLLAATGYAPGPHADLWRYFGANLEHICPALLFVIFFFARAGETWGLDGVLSRRNWDGE